MHTSVDYVYYLTWINLELYKHIYKKIKKRQFQPYRPYTTLHSCVKRRLTWTDLALVQSDGLFRLSRCIFILGGTQHYTLQLLFRVCTSTNAHGAYKHITDLWRGQAGITRYTRVTRYIQVARYTRVTRYFRFARYIRVTLFWHARYM